MYEIAQAVARFHAFFRSGLGNFVANRIKEHTRVVTRRFDQRRQIALPVRVKTARIVVVGFGNIPAVERFVHHVQAEPVAKIERDLRSGIVRNAHGVKAVFL